DLALDEHAPRHDGALEARVGGRRPAGSEQRGARERPFEAYPVEVACRIGVATGVDEQRAENEVRLVANREHGLVARADLAGRCELLQRILAAAVLEQRNA